MIDRTHVVYRCYATDDELLYVGRTLNLPQRRQQHKDSSSWWPRVAAITSTRPMTRSASRRYERMTICAEQPTHNVNSRSQPDHGSATRYVYGCQCRTCRDAHTVRSAERRRRRAVAVGLDPTVVTHGRRSTYSNWGCRCDACQEANSEYSRTRYAAERAAAAGVLVTAPVSTRSIRIARAELERWAARRAT